MGTTIKVAILWVNDYKSATIWVHNKMSALKWEQQYERNHDVVPDSVSSVKAWKKCIRNIGSTVNYVGEIADLWVESWN